MTKDEFIFLATDFLPNPDLKIFASKIFHLYDKNGNGFLDFAEFSSATDNLVRQGKLIIRLNNLGSSKLLTSSVPVGNCSCN